MKSTLEIINRMKTEGVIREYAIGGAVGATFYLEPVATVDIDIFMLPKKQRNAGLMSLSSIYGYLNLLGYKAKKEYIIIEGWPVQFLPPADALDEEAVKQAIETELEGVRIRVISSEHLVAMALRTGRPKDFARILQFIDRGVLNPSRLDRILDRHGLVEKWAQFGAKFLRGK